LIALALAAAAAALPAAGPTPGAVHVFRDWAVGCDNGGACQAVSQLPDAGLEKPGTISIARGSAPDAPLTIRLRAYEGERPATRIAVDGQARGAIRSVGDDVYAPAAAEAPTVLAALLGGSAATLIDDGEAVQGRASLAGLSAALRYLDDAQHRAGTVTALVAKGAAPASAVPARPALPVVRSVAVVDDAPPAPPALVKRMTAGAKCENEVPDSETHRIDPTHALILVTCWSGAYNTDAIGFVATLPGLTDPGPARFDYDAGPDARPGALHGGYWDGDAGRLKAVAKARGLGDCGTSTDWAWDGTRFRLVELRSMPDCRGAIDWIPLWRAAIAR
jgi:hypothetical protein